MALRAMLLGGLAIATLANALLQWRGASPAERRRPLLIALIFGSIALAAAILLLVNALAFRPVAPRTYGFLALGAFAGAVAMGALAARIAWRRAWPGVLVLAASIVLVRTLPESAAIITGATIFLLFALAAPRAIAAAWDARGRFGLMGAGILGGLLVLVGLFGGLTLLMGLGEGGLGSPAVHSMRVDVAPDTNATYELRVPLLEADSERGREPLALLVAKPQVIDGGATARTEGGLLIVEGSGPATIEFRRSFFGPGREAFTDWSLPQTALRIEGAAASVTLRVDLSGGEGHTCWARGEWTARVEPDAAAGFEDDGRDVPTLCV